MLALILYLTNTIFNLFLFWIYKQLCWQARKEKKHGKLNEATLRFACTLYSIIVFAILIRFFIAN